jgi:hypothetical protein
LSHLIIFRRAQQLPPQRAHHLFGGHHFLLFQALISFGGLIFSLFLVLINLFGAHNGLLSTDSLFILPPLQDGDHAEVTLSGPSLLVLPAKVLHCR